MMAPLHPSAAKRGFTLLELMIVLAIAAVVLVLAAPSFSRMIEIRRLRGISEQFQTDVQFTRSEAVSRQERVAISFGNDATMTCYTIHTCGTETSTDCRCECTAAASAGASGRCTSTSSMREIRTVQLLRNSGVTLVPERIGAAANIANRFVIDPTSGGMLTYLPTTVSTGPPTPPSEFWASTGLTSTADPIGLRARVNALGRTDVCASTGSLSGVSPC